MKKNSKMKLGALLLAVSMGGSLLVNSFAEGLTKKDALDKIYALENLTIAEKINLDKKIDKAGDDEIKQILETAKGIDSGRQFMETKKEESLSTAKKEAKEKIDKLEHLDNKPGFKTQIDVAKSVEEINSIVEEAKVRDASNLVEKTKEELGKENLLKQAKAKAKKEIDKLGLSKKDTAAMYKQIDEAETIAEVEQIVNLAKLAEKTKKDLGKENSSKKDKVDDLNINDIVNDDNKKPSEDDKKPSDDDKKPSDDDKKPSDDNKKPSKNDEKVVKNDNVAKKVDNKKNVKTGVAGIGGVLTTLFAATGAYFASKKNK